MAGSVWIPSRNDIILSPVHPMRLFTVHQLEQISVPFIQTSTHSTPFFKHLWLGCRINSIYQSTHNWLRFGWAIKDCGIIEFWKEVYCFSFVEWGGTVKVINTLLCSPPSQHKKTAQHEDRWIQRREPTKHNVFLRFMHQNWQMLKYL